MHPQFGLNKAEDSSSGNDNLHWRTPSVAERRTFWLLACIYGGITLSVLPWATVPGPRLPEVIAVSNLTIALADLCTTLLLGREFLRTGRLSMCVLASGYAFSAAMALLHLAVFPGALFDRMLFGNSQSTSWMFLLWRLGSAALLLAAVVIAHRPPLTRGAPALRRTLAFAGMLTAAAVAVAAILAAQLAIPVQVGGQFTIVNKIVNSLQLIFCAIALLLIWRGRAFDDAMWLWLVLVLVASLADQTLAITAGGQYRLGWHVAKASAAISACLLLVFWLGRMSPEENVGLIRAIAGYGAAIGTMLAAVLLRWFLSPWVAEQYPFATLFGAVAIGVWIAGWGPALTAAVGGYALAIILFDENGTRTLSLPQLFGAALYALSCAIIIALGEGMRRARDRYRASEHRFRRSQQGALQGFALLENVHRAGNGPSHLRCKYVNPAGAAPSGRSPEALAGADVAVLFPGAEANGLREALAQVADTGEPLDIEVQYASDGGPRWYRHLAVKLADGVAVSYIDTTDLRRSIEALKRQEQELRTVLDVVPLAVLVARDPSADDIVGSSSFAALTGVPVGENVSQSGPRKDALPYHYEQQGRILEAAELPMQQAARLGRVVRDMEMDMVFKDGRVIHLLSHATPLFDENERVRGAVGANVDITALTLARRALETADRQKNDFIATLAHELRNPLSPIRHAATILKRDTSPTAIEHAVRVVERQAAHMAHLLDDLLDVSRITRNAIKLRREPVDLHVVLDSAFENALPMLQEFGQRLQADIEATPLWVYGDPARMLQVMDNLLSNACKYTGTGGLINVRARREDDQCIIEVSDTGVGIAAQQLTSLFTMFAQVDPAMRTTKGGLGIGLAISRRLVELHGGKIAAHSEGPGKGSTFTVTFPRMHNEPAGNLSLAARGPSETDTDLKQLQVLVVDDNVDAANTLRTVLGLAGVTTAVAHSATAALAVAESMRPHALLLDLGLPDGSGLDVARRVRSSTWGRKVLLVALTGWGRPEDRARTTEAGFDSHLVKPADSEQVLALLKQFVRASQKS